MSLLVKSSNKSPTSFFVYVVTLSASFMKITLRSFSKKKVRARVCGVCACIIEAEGSEEIDVRASPLLIGGNFFLSRTLYPVGSRLLSRERQREEQRKLIARDSRLDIKKDFCQKTHFSATR